jgi:hypothetical protein
MRRPEPAARAAAAGLVAAVLGLAGCGDNAAGVDHTVRHDADVPDTAGLPPPPALGPQIDRAGRPLITTALIAPLVAAGPARTAIRDAYNHATDPATWKDVMLPNAVSIERELEASLAVFDAFDRGMTSVAGAGCGNAIRYPGSAGPDSYKVAADLFADDELHVDTSRASCPVYFALELEYASSGDVPHTTCGGRMPGHDVVDVTYSVLAAGQFGIDAASDFAPRLRDAVTVHGDIKDSFPFLGPPR